MIITKDIIGHRGQGKDFKLINKMLYKICINTYGFAFIFLKRIAKHELLKDAYEFIFEIKPVFDKVFDDEDNSNE